MIPLWTEDKRLGFLGVEKCAFCNVPTKTWHENTNSPICLGCAKVKKVADIPEDNGQRIRYRKRIGTFVRDDVERAN